MNKNLESNNHGLTVLRGLSVLMVVFSHLNPMTNIGINFKFGNLGVIGFFTLSSYLICSKLFYNKFSYWKFMRRRFIRIYPLFVFNLILFTIVINMLFYSQSFNIKNWELFDIPSWLTLVANYTFKIEQWDTPFSHLWSICVEMHYYLFLPLVAYFSIRRRNLILFIGVLVPIFANFYVSLNLDYPSVWVQSTSHMSAFAIGALIANNEDRIIKHHKFPYQIIIIVLALVLYYFTGLQSFFSGQWTGFSYLISSVFFGCLIITQLTSRRQYFRVIHFLGLMSYSIYLVHFPFILIYISYFNISTGLDIFNSFLCFIGILIVSTAYFYILEKPILRIKSKIKVN